MDKKYEYRNGEPARVLCVDSGHDNFPVVSVNKHGYVNTHTKHGTYWDCENEMDEWDLIEVKEKKKPGPRTLKDASLVKDKSFLYTINLNMAEYLYGTAEEHDASVASVIDAHIFAAKKSDYLSIELDGVRGTKRKKRKKVKDLRAKYLDKR